MILTTVLTLLVAGAAFAADPVPPRAPDTPIPAAEDQPAAFAPEGAGAIIQLESVPADADKSAAEALRPAMLEDLRVAREQETRRVAELTASLATASSPEQQLELQRQISEAKSDGMLQTMTIQLDYARRGGQAELAQRLEADIEQFETLRNAPRAPINTDSVRDRQASGGAAR
jgi:hypothetical protein